MKTLFKPIKPICTFLFLLIIAFGCDNPEPEPAESLINPADANALSRVLIMPTGTQNAQGAPPVANSSAGNGQVNSQQNQVTSSNGSTVPLRFLYSNINGSLRGCYVRVAGANSYFNLPLTNQSGASGQLLVPLGIPTNVDEGNFCVEFSVYDAQGRVSNVAQACVEVLRLGTGALQISLSWDTATDQDLHVTDPSGTNIYYANSTSSTGGELDRDDINGYGPENIFWLQDAPNGEYIVKVHDYERSSTNNTCYVTVNAPGKSKSFTLNTRNGQTVEVVRINKSGNNYNF